MAQITLDNLAHSYLPNPKGEEDFALKQLDHVWGDGEPMRFWAPRAAGNPRC